MIWLGISVFFVAAVVGVLAYGLAYPEIDAARAGDRGRAAEPSRRARDRADLRRRPLPVHRANPRRPARLGRPCHVLSLRRERRARYPDVVRRIAADGHQIGNHTYSHPYLYFDAPRPHRRGDRPHPGHPRAAHRPASDAVPVRPSACAGSRCRRSSRTAASRWRCGTSALTDGRYGADRIARLAIAQLLGRAPSSCSTTASRPTFPRHGRPLGDGGRAALDHRRRAQGRLHVRPALGHAVALE